MPVEARWYLSVWYIIAIFAIFNSCSVALPIRLMIPRDSFLVSPTSSKLYSLSGGLCVSLGNEVDYGVTLALGDGVGDSGGG